MLLGPPIDAMVIERFAQKEKGKALKAGWGVLVGTLLGAVLRSGVAGMMAYYFIRGL